MPNPQLTEYIKNQLKLGVSRDAIRAALLQAGWGQADVSEALAGAAPQGAPPLTQSKTGTSSSPITVDIFRPKEEPVFQPKRGPESKMPPSQIAAAGPKSTPSVQPTVIATVSKESRRDLTQRIILAGVAVVAVVALGFAIWANVKRGSLAREVEGLTAARADLENRNNEFIRKINELTTEVRTLTEENKELSLGLSFFVPLQTPTTTAVTVRGALGGGSGKTPYTLTLNRGIILTLKNSRDAKIESLLRPFLGESVEVSGTYISGSRDVTVDVVNEVKIDSDTATSTQATSTPLNLP